MCQCDVHWFYASLFNQSWSLVNNSRLLKTQNSGLKNLGDVTVFNIVKNHSWRIYTYG